MMAMKLVNYIDLILLRDATIHPTTAMLTSNMKLLKEQLLNVKGL